jgi:hypothetical protein
MTDRGGQVCKVAQLAVLNRAFEPTVTDGQTFSEGWYYDDFSEAVLDQCSGETRQTIAFTPAANPPTGVTVKLQCLSELHPLASANADIMLGRAEPNILHEPELGANSCSAGPESVSAARVGDACSPDAVPPGGFNGRVYVGAFDPECNGGVCLVYRLRGDPDQASTDEVARSVYCSCRCNAPEGYAQCGCPSGFTCQDALHEGSDDIRGGYCVRD